MELSEKLSYPIKNSPFYPRPLCFLCAVFLCSLFFFKLNMIAFVLFFLLVSAYSVFLGVTDRRGGRFCNPMPLLIMLAVFLAVLLSLSGMINYNRVSRLEGEHTLKATVTDVYYEEMFGSLYKAEMTEIDGKKVSGCAELYFEYDPMLSVYDTVEFKADISAADKEKDFFDRLLLKSENVLVIAESCEVTSVSNEGRKGLEFAIYKIRSAIGRRLDSVLLPKTSAYAKALLIGDKSGLGTAFRTDMSALGISHILAVSGMHMSIIAMLVTFMADRFKTSRKLKSLLLIAFGLVFTAVAGFSPSVIRAYIMMTLGLCAVFFGGKGDPLTSLALSGVVICVFEPSTVISCSFLLSFFATLGIVLCALYTESTAAASLYRSKTGDMRLPFKVLRKLLFALVVTLCATLFTAPVISLYFSEISFFSFVMNLIAIPMAFLSMVLTLLCLVFGGSAFLGDTVCALFDGLFEVFENFVHLVARSFTTSVSLRYPFFAICCALLLSALIFFWIVRVRNPLAVLSAFLAVATVYAGAVQVYSIVNADRGEVRYYATESSEGLLVNSGASTMYIDIGNGSKVVPLLALEDASELYYETELDAYMITHYHSGHIGTFKRLVRAYKIDKLYLPYPETAKEQEFYDGIMLHLDRTEAVMYRRGEAVSFGAATVLSTPYSLLERSEHPILAVKVSFGENSLLYLGSAVTEADVLPFVETMLSDSSAVLCGRHGPVTKENEPYLLYNSETEVYLSPFEDICEQDVFPNGKFTYLTADGEGKVRARFVLAG